MSILPEIAGTCPIGSPPREFCARMQRRVDAGLLSGRPHPRSSYAVTHASPTGLRIRALGWWTAINVGLNELDLEAPRAGLVRYRIRYWRWAAFGILLSAGLGVVGLALLLAADVRSYIAAHQQQMVPGLSVDQNLLLAWGLVLFWGFVWPWVLIHLHQRPLRRLVEGLISEVDAGSAAARARG